MNAPDPILIDVPDQIESPRLLMRCPRRGDGATVAASVRESLRELQPWMVWATDNYSVTDGELWCRRGLATFVTRTAMPYLLFNRDGVHVGTLNLFALNWSVPKGELGYWLRTSHAGQGLMTEAVDTLARRLFEEHAFHRIEIRTDDANTRSAAVAERCGFALEGTLQNESRTPGPELRHLRIYAKLPAVSR